ncbi:hypothetical protein EC957_010705, partial [Mortierella hygrophila]
MGLISADWSNKPVVSKNTNNQDFAFSTRVFVDLRQTRLEIDGSRPGSQILFQQLQDRFQDFCTRYDQYKQSQTHGVQPKSSDDTIARLRVPSSFNRCRTIESPAPVSKDSEPFPQRPPTASLELLRFSFKERRGNVAREPPSKAKKLVWKPPKKAPESPDDTSTSSTKKDSKKKDAKAKKTWEKPSSNEGSNSYAEKDKQSLVRSLGWHHPISSLEVGTLKTNIDRALTDRPDLQLEAINCINEGSELAVNIKRKAQGHISGFLEKLRTRMKAAEESKRQKLRKAGKSMSESGRPEIRRDAVTMDERETLDYLCERVEPEVNKCGDDDADDIQENSCGLDALKDKGRLEDRIDILIQKNISAAENYLAFNELIPYSCTTLTSISDLESWIGGQEPQVIIKKFISDIDPLVEETKPKDYHRIGYIPQGPIRTDGFLIKVMTFKLRERPDARFKRLVEQNMPSRITSTVAGVNGFLQEIRNVIKSGLNIKGLWPGKDVDRMKVLTLDRGQACVVGAFAHPPNGLNGKENAEEGSSMDEIITTNQESTSLASQGSASVDPVPASASTFTSAQPPVTDSLVTISRPACCNLAVKQKA